MADPVRLDVWLAADRAITRHAATVLIDAGLVTVNGRLGRAGQRIREGDAVAVGVPAAPVAAAPEPPEAQVHVNVVYEDELLAVIDKPAGLVVHPAPGHRAGTLADGLRQRGTTWSLLGGAERPGIVHRLDRDTSGLLVVAKTEAAHRALAAQLQDRTLGRRYWALVRGRISEETGRIDAPIGRDPRDRKRMTVIDTGRASITDFEVIARHRLDTELDVTLRSGRTHQIRVHLAYIGKPIVGDPIYGRRDDRGMRAVFHRPALHARMLRFIHPGDGSNRQFESPLPDDLVELSRRAREGTA